MASREATHSLARVDALLAAWHPGCPSGSWNLCLAFDLRQSNLTCSLRSSSHIHRVKHLLNYRGSLSIKERKTSVCCSSSSSKLPVDQISISIRPATNNYFCSWLIGWVFEVWTGLSSSPIKYHSCQDEVQLNVRTLDSSRTNMTAGICSISPLQRDTSTIEYLRQWVCGRRSSNFYQQGHQDSSLSFTNWFINSSSMAEFQLKWVWNLFMKLNKGIVKLQQLNFPFWRIKSFTQNLSVKTKKKTSIF